MFRRVSSAEHLIALDMFKKEYSKLTRNQKRLVSKEYENWARRHLTKLRYIA